MLVTASRAEADPSLMSFTDAFGATAFVAPPTTPVKGGKYRLGRQACSRYCEERECDKELSPLLHDRLPCLLSPLRGITSEKTLKLIGKFCLPVPSRERTIDRFRSQ